MYVEREEGKPLRHGYTTGACATATAKAALLALILQEEQQEVEIRLPMGQIVPFQIVKCSFNPKEATTGVIKDGGDDPDATHGALILCTVSWCEEPGIHLDGGVGVGRVTKPGLPIEVGLAAINPVPRKMIQEAVQEVLDELDIHRGVKVVVSVPEGEEIAKKTLNGRLGIIGGISILGTRGIVVPFSSSSYMASIMQAIKVATLEGCEHIVLATGGRSEKVGMGLYPDLKEESFVEMGDFVGFSLKQCRIQKVKKVTLVGMMGKFSKLAQGKMNVHSKSSQIDFEFLVQVAGEAGAPVWLQEQIRGCNTASQAGDLILEHGYTQFFEILCRYCCQVALEHMKGDIEVETVISTLKGVVLGRVKINEKDH